MDYEKKYKEAIKRAKNLQENSNGMILNKWLTGVFPELKESEESADERIRKAIISIVAFSPEAVFDKVSVLREDCLTWIEKQGKKEEPQVYEIENDKTITYSETDGYKVVKPIEHKFNVGDWLVSIHNSNDLLHIIGVDDKDYEVETPYGNTGVPSIAYVDSHFRRWTINDAKEGDVLVSKNGNPFIYNGNYNSLHIGAYCGITCDDNKFKVAEEKCHWTENAGIEPSTKEQRDLLFTKMKEAGYEFDFENKELNKKIEQKSVDKIELKFSVGDWVVNKFGDSWHIDSFDKKNYQVSDGKGNYNYFPISKQNEAHHWTIQDAKDGDVLFHSDSASNGIFIFKKTVQYGFSQKVVCYCDYDSEDGFCLGEKHTCCWTDSKILHPATKEQRNLLFQTMKEKGYEWDDEKKKLKKIDQKFKVGDWIVTDKNDRVQIKAVNNDYYTIDNGMYFNVPYVDRYCHLWTIQDARAGDVLAFDDETIVIFKDLYNTTTFHSYCHIEDGMFDISKDDMPDWWESEGFHPATKEQYDLLFQKMKEEGWKWNVERKEMKKIEQKPADKAKPVVFKDFYSVFSKEQVEEIDRRIEESQRLYNAKLMDAIRKAKDFPMIN